MDKEKAELFNERNSFIYLNIHSAAGAKNTAQLGSRKRSVNSQARRRKNKHTWSLLAPLPPLQRELDLHSCDAQPRPRCRIGVWAPATGQGPKSGESESSLGKQGRPSQAVLQDHGPKGVRPSEQADALCWVSVLGHRAEKIGCNHPVRRLKGFLALLGEPYRSQCTNAIPAVSNVVTHKDPKALEKALSHIATSLGDAKEFFKKMRDYVDPDQFFHVLRIYLSGWKGNPKLSDGLLYEGVWDTPRKFSGGSAGQNSIFQCLDVLLGIKHKTGEGSPAEFLQEMREYMPPDHREFLCSLESGPSVGEFVISTGDKDLKNAYNECVNGLVSVRKFHLGIVDTYIVRPSKQQPKEGCKSEEPSNTENRGTGGTDVMNFLKSVKDATEKALLG
ncbi:indoleamine 2,3-dioxygenase 1-like [Meriones unguiculatus]|uniref:indoleamine 2,3-dioxygenase 1-like n=1 Tax=Meriones unguiculatus TaxID=10047 RepID=UPI00293EF9B3|nr:indoleamine 2,3-dioxygenase 1-like [Meriones unguiculatus]